MKENLIRFITVVCVASAVLVLCLMTFFTVARGTENFNVSEFVGSFLLNFPICVVMVYVDFSVVRYTMRFRRLSSTLKLLADLIVTEIIVTILCVVTNMLYYSSGKIDFIREILPSLLLGGITTLCVEFYFLGLRHSSDSKRLLEIEKENAKYQYEALKNQINPHFLFNCLNVIASLAYENPDKTNLFTKRLSNVYRYLLTTRTKNIVPVADELKFAGEYAFLQQIRFENNLKITIINSGESNEKMIVPASIQMSVENAIKHNVCNSTNPLNIVIEVHSDCVTVRNSLNRLKGSGGTGTGIDNLRTQFRNNGEEIRITESGDEYIIQLPFIHTSNR